MKKLVAMMMVIGGLFTGVAVVVDTPAVEAWVTTELSVEGDGCERALVTATNVEDETATVRQSNGVGFQVGDTIPANDTLTVLVEGVGVKTVEIAVDYPSDGQDRSASTTFTLEECPPETTTTTEAPTTTVTVPDSILPTQPSIERELVTPRFTG